jgi:hypothetical protein
MNQPYELRLNLCRSIWTILRMTWLPLLSGAVGIGLAVLIATQLPAAIAITPVLPLLGFVIGGAVSFVLWGRGPKLRIADGNLTIGAEQAPVSAVAARVEEYVFQSQSRYAAGRFWLPVVILTMPAGERRIVRRQGGGRAQGRPTSVRPEYELDPTHWDELVRRLGVTVRPDQLTRV